MSDVVYLTPEGKADLERELDLLIRVQRPELARKLSEAVAQGDLKENADYHDAKEKQAFLEGRIQYIESTLRAAQIIEKDDVSDVVRVGSTVVIIEEGMDEEETYVIVGAAEANPSNGKISNASPIGRALLGQSKGKKVKVETPGGTVTFKIKDVR